MRRQRERSQTRLIFMFGREQMTQLFKDMRTYAYGQHFMNLRSSTSNLMILRHSWRHHLLDYRARHSSVSSQHILAQFPTYVLFNHLRVQRANLRELYR